MLPILTVEKDSFKNLVSGLSRGVKPPCRETTLNHLIDKKNQMINRLQQTLNQIDYVCTTADIWSNNQKSYMGVTCHYINENLNRCSVVLGCRRIKFSHTYLEIGQLLTEIHKSFNLVGKKLVGTVTDNASNFAKSFRVFSIPENIENAQDIDFINNDDQCNISVSNIPNFETLESSNDIEQESDEDNYVIDLPQHFRCCSHTLNLIATVDIQEALKNTAYKKIYNSTFGKLTALWNVCHRSTKASDVIESICKYKLIIPCPTRWNSFYDSVTRILLIKEYLPQIFEKLQKPKLKSSELEFLEEYRNVMQSLAKGIDLLQGEENCYLGFILPILLQIRETLNSLTHLIYCESLKNAILSGLSKRYCHILDLQNSSSKPYILATVSLPKFKLKWLTNKDDEIKSIKSLFLLEMEKIYKSMEKKEISDDHIMDVDEDGFFEILKNKNDIENNIQIDNKESSSSVCDMQFLKYLNDKSKELKSLHNYNIILIIFKLYNTVLPSSAQVERLFSTGGQILIPKRNRLSDEHFEMLLMLKKNKNI